LTFKKLVRKIYLDVMSYAKVVET